MRGEMIVVYSGSVWWLEEDKGGGFFLIIYFLVVFDIYMDTVSFGVFFRVCYCNIIFENFVCEKITNLQGVLTSFIFN